MQILFHCRLLGVLGALIFSVSTALPPITANANPSGSTDPYGTVVLAQSTRTCSMAFEVTLYDGPSAPLSLAGALTLQIEPSGSVTGELTSDVLGVDGADASAVLPAAPIPVVGQINGRSVNLVLQLAEDKHVFGSGSSTTDLSGCDGPIDGSVGGAAVGPEEGDRGDWLGKYCVLVPNPFGGLFNLCLPG